MSEGDSTNGVIEISTDSLKAEVAKNLKSETVSGDHLSYCIKRPKKLRCQNHFVEFYGDLLGTIKNFSAETTCKSGVILSRIIFRVFMLDFLIGELTVASYLIRVVCVVRWTILSMTSFPLIMIAIRRI